MTAAGGTAVFIPIYMIPIFFQFTRNDTALEAGVRLLPFILLMIFAVISNGGECLEIFERSGYGSAFYDHSHCLETNSEILQRSFPRTDITCRGTPLVVY
jgi:hypothetical protein